MSGILDLVLSQVAGGQLESIGEQLGVPPETAGRAVEAALPALLGGLARNATASPEGAASLASALERDHDGSVLDNLGPLLGMLGGGSGGGGGLGGLLGGGSGGGGGLGGLIGAAGSLLGGGKSAPSAKTVDGSGILKHILGSKQGAVEGAVGQASGLDSAKAGKLLMMLAPVVMGALGREKRSQNLDADGLASMLGQERDRMQESTPGVGGLLGMLDQDGDGDIKDDLTKLGTGLLGSFLKGRR